MKKLVFIMGLVFAVLTAQAQQVYNINSIEAAPDGSRLAVSGPVRFPLNPYVYSTIKSAPADYRIVAYTGEEGCVVTIAHISQIDHYIAVVDTVSITDNDGARITFTNGDELVISDSEWLKIQPGQKVESWVIEGLTKRMWRSHTVSRDTPETGLVECSTPDEATAAIINASLRVVERSMEPPTRTTSRETAQNNNGLRFVEVH